MAIAAFPAFIEDMKVRSIKPYLLCSWAKCIYFLDTKSVLEGMLLPSLKLDSMLFWADFHKGTTEWLLWSITICGSQHPGCNPLHLSHHSHIYHERVLPGVTEHSERPCCLFHCWPIPQLARGTQNFPLKYLILSLISCSKHAASSPICILQTESLFMAVAPLVPNFLAGIAVGAGRPHGSLLFSLPIIDAC